MAYGVKIKKESDGSDAGAVRTETTSSRVWTLPDKDGTLALTFNRYIKGATHDRYIIPMVASGTNPGTSALPTNTLRATHFEVYTSLTLDRIAVDVSSGTGNIRLGIWNTDSSGYPTTLAVSSGAMAISTTGVVAATISVTLTPGLYMIGFVADTAIIVRALTTNTGAHMGFGGNSTGWNVIALYMWSVAFTYGTLGTFPAGATIANVAVPLIGVRATTA